MTTGRLVIAIAAIVFSLSGIERAAACGNKDLIGVWENPAAHDRHITRVEVTQDCHIDNKSTWAAKFITVWKIRVWSRCQPADCAWGRVLGRKEEGGPLTAAFETFSASRLVELEASGDNLNVRYKIDFRSKALDDVSGVALLTRVD